ncbi:MAG: hypothetical protein AAFO79_05225 [Pseudomonadota bacterium]
MIRYRKGGAISAWTVAGAAMVAMAAGGVAPAYGQTFDWFSVRKPATEQPAPQAPAGRSGETSDAGRVQPVPVTPAPGSSDAAPAGVPAQSGAQAGAQADPRAGDPKFEQARKLMRAVDAVLKDVARQRGEASKLPSNDDMIVTPFWVETREDREANIRALLDAALGVVTDVPIVDLQKTIKARRQAIVNLNEQIVQLKEKQLSAPQDAMLPGILSDTVGSLQEEIEDLEQRIVKNHHDVAAAKTNIGAALKNAGITMSPEQQDLLLDSVLSEDLVKLVAAFNAAKLIDEQLARMVEASGDNMFAARKFFAMHAALFAMLVHAQDELIGKIDTQYLPRLDAIGRDIKRARGKTDRLLREDNRPDQVRALRANRKSQDFAARVAKYYRGYLLQQRAQLAAARARAVKDLQIADNTYETVEASVQLRALIKDATASFEAIQRLEAPGFDQIFQDQELRREFENLTRKLDVPTS